MTVKLAFSCGFYQAVFLVENERCLPLIAFNQQFGVPFQTYPVQPHQADDLPCRYLASMFEHMEEKFAGLTWLMHSEIN